MWFGGPKTQGFQWRKGGGGGVIFLAAELIFYGIPHQNGEFPLWKTPRFGASKNDDDELLIPWLRAMCHLIKCLGVFQYTLGCTCTRLPDYGFVEGHTAMWGIHSRPLSGRLRCCTSQALAARPPFHSAKPQPAVPQTNNNSNASKPTPPHSHNATEKPH